MSLFNGVNMLMCRMRTLKNICRRHRRFLTNSSDFQNDTELISFSPEQQEKILASLHKCVRDNTTRTHLSYRRLQSLRELFERHPDVSSVEALLSITGLGPRVLHKLCESILHDGLGLPPSDVVDTPGDPPPLTRGSSLITPSLISQREVETLISVQVGVNAVSWARLRIDTAEVDVWDIMDVSDRMDKKYDVHTVWEQAIHLRDLVPNGDIYVMENSNWSNVASVKKPMKFHIQQAMLTTAVCSVMNQLDQGGEPRAELDNRVFFLRAYLSSRLFRKLVGSERVSAQDVVERMIRGEAEEWHRPVHFAPDVVSCYEILNGPLRENMSQNLLLAVSFLELALRKNPDALRIIGKTNGFKKKPATPE